MKTGEKTGNVVGALTVTENDELMLITTKGQMVRTRVKEIRETGRNAMGVKLMDLRGAEKLQAIAPDPDTLISWTTCLRPRNSSMAVLDAAECRVSERSSIERCSVRGIIPPSRKKLDATST